MAKAFRSFGGFLLAAIACFITGHRAMADDLPAACVGDCSTDQVVTIDELIKCVNIALGSLPSDACPACAESPDALVQVTDLVVAVNNALFGCGRPAPTATPTYVPLCDASRVNQDCKQFCGNFLDDGVCGLGGQIQCYGDGTCPCIPECPPPQRCSRNEDCELSSRGCIGGYCCRGGTCPLPEPCECRCEVDGLQSVCMNGGGCVCCDERGCIPGEVISPTPTAPTPTPTLCPFECVGGCCDFGGEHPCFDLIHGDNFAICVYTEHGNAVGCCGGSRCNVSTGRCE